VVSNPFRIQVALFSVLEPGGWPTLFMFSWFLQSFQLTVGLEWYLAAGRHGLLCCSTQRTIAQNITVKVLSAFLEIGSLFIATPSERITDCATLIMCLIYGGKWTQ
jgi:hypothetical protein